MVKKTFSRKLFLLAFFAALTSVTSAQEWTLIGETNFYSSYVDSSSIKHGKLTSTAWFKEEYSVIQEFSPTDFQSDTHSYDKAISLIEFDSKGRFRMLKTTTYREGSVLDTAQLRDGDKTGWSYATPGTLGDSMIKFITKHYRDNR